MPMPTGVGIIDTMIAFPASNFEQYDFIRKQLKDSESAEFDFPVEYMFKGVPKEKYGADDPIALTALGRDGRLRRRMGPDRLRGRR